MSTAMENGRSRAEIEMRVEQLRKILHPMIMQSNSLKTEEDKLRYKELSEELEGLLNTLRQLGAA